MRRGSRARPSPRCERGTGQHLEAVVTDHGAAGLSALTRWLGTVEVEVHRWGVDLVPFPGLD